MPAIGAQRPVNRDSFPACGHNRGDRPVVRVSGFPAALHTFDLRFAHTGNLRFILPIAKCADDFLRLGNRRAVDVVHSPIDPFVCRIVNPPALRALGLFSFMGLSAFGTRFHGLIS